MRKLHTVLMPQSTLLVKFPTGQLLNGMFETGVGVKFKQNEEPPEGAVV